MKKTSLIIGIFLFSLSLMGQTVVTLNHQGNTTLYRGANAVVEANAAAVNGDTINIPGGFFTSITISKKLVIFGTGHFPDSLNATGRSYLTSGLTLNDGSDSSHIEGLYINGDINFASNADIDDVIIKRCNFSALNFSGTTKNNNRALINQNVIRGSADFNNASYLTFSNNILVGRIYNATENIMFDHNNLLTCIGYNNGNCFTTVSNVIFSNNILQNTWSSYSGFLAGENNVFQNNLFNFDPTGSWSNNVYTSNIISVNSDSIFVNHALNTGFEYTHDFNLKSTSSGKNAATDGTDIGIYGGLPEYTYKTSWMPANPHISTKTIAPTTDSNGKLGVNIKVNAQDK